jgi:hypothetical protein
VLIGAAVLLSTRPPHRAKPSLEVTLNI